MHAQILFTERNTQICMQGHYFHLVASCVVEINFSFSEIVDQSNQ